MEKKKTSTTKETKKKEVKLNPAVWDVPYNADLVAQLLYVYSSNERKGSAKQKGRGEVSGGGKKPWKQKGTGRARSGSSRSPLWIGGGVTFASNGRNFTKKINKKMAKKATCVMLSERLRKKELEFTNLTVTACKKLRNSAKEKTLVVTDDENAVHTLKNSQKVNIVGPLKLNAKHIVSARKIVVQENNIKDIEQRLANEK